MDGHRIGAKLRILREQAGLSQRQLAKRAGVAHASVSLLESGQTNPSVGALKRLLDAIPVSLSAFFSEADAPPDKPAFFYRGGDLPEIGRDGISYRQVAADVPDRKLLLLAETYAPGTDTGRILLRHEGQEGGIIISGRLEVFVGEEHAVLGPGDAYYFDSHLPHRFRNAGPQPCIVVSACAPPSF